MTLIDYPGKIATTVFTVGCNFRCPFCHNPELVIPSQEDIAAYQGKDEEFFRFLETRKGLLDGVCITGGEPTIHHDIVPFIRRIRNAGFLVKLDSNGTRPGILAEVLRDGLVDYVAMDIKNGIKRYGETVGVETNAALIRESIGLIMNGGADYEFRTTVVPGIHTEDDFDGIGTLIRGAKRYYLQSFRPGKILAGDDERFGRGVAPDLAVVAKKMERYVREVSIRE